MLRDPRRRRHRKAQRAAGRDDGSAGTSGAAAGRADSARRGAVQRRRGRRTPRDHTRRCQQFPAAGPGPPRRGRTRRRNWPSPTTAKRRELLDRYCAAFENADMAALTELLQTDITLEMPPLPVWFMGRDPVMQFLTARAFAKARRHRMIPTAANGQPAVAEYRRTADDVMRAHSIHVLTSATGAVRDRRHHRLSGPRVVHRVWFAAQPVSPERSPLPAPHQAAVHRSLPIGRMGGQVVRRQVSRVGVIEGWLNEDSGCIQRRALSLVSPAERPRYYEPGSTCGWGRGRSPAVG